MISTNKLTEEDFRSRCLSYGYGLMSPYVNMGFPVTIECLTCKTQRTSRPYNIQPVPCVVCLNKAKRESVVNAVLEEAQSKGFSITIEPREGKKANAFVISGTCQNGHIIRTSIGKWNSGQQCSACHGNRRLTLDFVSSELLKEGYSVKPGQTYTKNLKHLTFICNDRHEYDSSWSKWTHGIRCSVCNGGLPLTHKQVVEKIEARGIFKYLSGEHTGLKSYFEVICVANNHQLTVRFDGLAYEDRECSICSKMKGRSKAEIEIEEWLSGLGYDVVVSDREQISPLELDIYLPDQKLAIEYCGLYYHSSVFKDPKAHQLKYKACQSKGINLLTVFEDEWEKRKYQLKGLIKSKLRTSRNRIQARKCKIERLDFATANGFVESWHIQGGTRQIAHSWGAKYEGELIGVICLARHHRNSSEWVINRLAFHPDYVSPGLFQRLLSRAVEHCQQNEIQSLTTFSDCRYSSGTLYEKCGFTIDGKIKPDYSYVRGLSRVSKQSLKKKLSEKNIGQTEEELRSSAGYNKIFDCGKIRWVLDIASYAQIEFEYSESGLPALPSKEPKHPSKRVLTDTEMKIRKRIITPETAAKKCLEAANVTLKLETYVNAHTKATFVCSKHGEFESTPTTVMLGHGHSQNSRTHNVSKPVEYFLSKFPESIIVEVLKFDGMKKQASVVVNGKRYNMIAANLITKLKSIGVL